jgi:hypothetical protein
MPLKRPKSLALAIGLASLAGFAQAENVTPNLQVNGFLTAGVTWIDDDHGGGSYGNDPFTDHFISEDPDSSYDTVLGLQLTYSLSDKFDLVGQLVSDGRHDYDTVLEWGYVAYRMNDKVRLRAGRFASPYYMHSQSSRVGQSYPWARPPIELYNAAPQRSLDGFDMQVRQSLNEDWAVEAQLYLGGAREAWGRSKTAHGLNLNLSSDSFTLHAGYGVSVIDWEFPEDRYGIGVAQSEYLYNLFGPNSYSSKDNDASFTDVGFTFDNGEWLAMGEFGQLDIEGWGPSLNAGYLTLGHYFGKWLPFVSAAKSDYFDQGDCSSHFGVTQATAAATLGQAQGAQGLAQLAFAQTGASGLPPYGTPEANLAFLALQQINQQVSDLQGAIALMGAAVNVTCNGTEQTSYSVGFRYDATKNVSVKAQVDHATDFKGGMTGLLGRPGYMADDVNVFSFNVNAAF